MILKFSGRLGILCINLLLIRGERRSEVLNEKGKVDRWVGAHVLMTKLWKKESECMTFRV